MISNAEYIQADPRLRHVQLYVYVNIYSTAEPMVLLLVAKLYDVRDCRLRSARPRRTRLLHDEYMCICVR